jgi:KDO2-lipid IV(A) lauroyltransferase
MKSIRERSGCRFFERRSEGAALKAALRQPGMLLGLLADQHAGDGGLCLPFFGRDCSMSPAPAIFALRYGCRLHAAICYRIGLAQWRIEFGDEIQTRKEGRARSVEEITAEISRTFEDAVRRDPANWFWVHNRWKPARLISRVAHATPRKAPMPGIPVQPLEN